MRISRQSWPAHSLLHRANGVAAEDVRRALGVSPVGRMVALERRVAELERHLAMAHRHFRGFRLADSRTPVVPDANGWIQLYSDDDTVTVQRDPNKHPNVIDLTVDEENLDIEAGCPAAIVTIIDCDDTSLTATECGATLDFAPGTYVSLQLSGSANAMVLTPSFCVPTADAPAPGETDMPYGPPAGFVRIPVGEPCAGGCASKLVPYWNPAA